MWTSRKTTIILALTLCLIILTLSISRVKSNINNEDYIYRRIIVNVFPDGSSRISILVAIETSEPYIYFPLIGSNPQYLIVVDQNMNPISFEVVNATYLKVYTYGKKILNITYFTNTLTSKDALWYLSFHAPAPCEVYLPGYFIVLGVKPNPREIIKQDTLLCLLLDRGEVNITYYIPLKIPTKGGALNKYSRVLKEHMFEIILTMVVVASSFVTYKFVKYAKYLLVLKRADEIERAIVEELKRRGGEAYQHEIMRKLEYPRTTVWRHIKKLEEKGVVKIEKRGKHNYLKLKI